MFQKIIVDKANTGYLLLLLLSCCVARFQTRPWFQANISLSAHMPGKELCGEQNVYIAINKY